MSGRPPGAFSPWPVTKAAVLRRSVESFLILRVMSYSKSAVFWSTGMVSVLPLYKRTIPIIASLSSNLSRPMTLRRTPLTPAVSASFLAV